MPGLNQHVWDAWAQVSQAQRTALIRQYLGLGPNENPWPAWQAIHPVPRARSIADMLGLPWNEPGPHAWPGGVQGALTAAPIDTFGASQPPESAKVATVAAKQSTAVLPAEIADSIEQEFAGMSDPDTEPARSRVPMLVLFGAVAVLVWILWK